MMEAFHNYGIRILDIAPLNDFLTLPKLTAFNDLPQKRIFPCGTDQKEVVRLTRVNNLLVNIDTDYESPQTDVIF